MPDTRVFIREPVSFGEHYHTEWRNFTYTDIYINVCYICKPLEHMVL